MFDDTPTVYIVDDDAESREALGFMIRGMGLNVETYPSAEAFLDAHRDSSKSPECMVLDVRMPGLSGLGLQQVLAASGKAMPTIMISGCADIPTVVGAMSAGAVDFLEKPVSGQTLAACVREAIDCSVRQRREADRRAGLLEHIETLSPRQREVFDLLVAGERSKQIARRLGIGEKTVAKHRILILEKMGVDSVVELVRLASEANLSPQVERPAVAPRNRAGRTPDPCVPPSAFEPFDAAQITERTAMPTG